MLNAKHVNGVEEWRVVPDGDWKDDANDLGSNDFRSTRRFILSASLEDKNQNIISVLSSIFLKISKFLKRASRLQKPPSQAML